MSSGENPFGNEMVAGRSLAEAGDAGRKARKAINRADRKLRDVRIGVRGWDMEAPRCLAANAALACEGSTSATVVGYLGPRCRPVDGSAPRHPHSVLTGRHSVRTPIGSPGATSSASGLVVRLPHL